MKKGFAIFLSLVLLLQVTGNSLAANVITPVLGSGQNLGIFTSLALYNGDIPIISYENLDNGYVYVLTCPNPECNPFLVARNIDIGGMSSLELNGSGFPVLSYESSGDLKIAICQDLTCLNSTIQTLASTGVVGYYNSLELDSGGYPVISYYDLTNTSLNLTYCISQPDCSSGIIIGREIDNSANVGSYSSLALNSSGFPVISYFDQTNGDLKLAVCADATCVNKAIVTVDSVGEVGAYSSLALNSNDLPVISYYDDTNSQLKIAVCGNTTCTSGNIITTLDDTVTSGIDSSVELNNNGYPVVSYHNLAQKDLKIAVCGNSTCTSGNIIRTLDASGDVGSYTSLAINNNNEPVISYFDDSNDDLKLAIADFIPPVVTSITRADASPANAASVSFTVTFSEDIYLGSFVIEPFKLTTSGISGASITGVNCTIGSGSGSTCTVTVSTGTGNGTIRLDVPVPSTIVDYQAGNQLTGTTYIGPTYSIVRNQTFQDVPTSYWAWQYIERLYIAGITGGCTTSPLNYCPTSPVTRAQMAIFLEKGMHGSSFSPPNVAATFTDTSGHWAEDWIEALKNDGITSGCGTGIYCPEDAVTRAQMAIFLLKAKHGSSYTPPAATGVFTDVATTYWAAAWIEQLAAEGITSGCAAGTYCPDNSVTRDQMAVFLVKAFNLP